MEEIKKREYPQEMLLMGGCPNCGEEVNREFVEKTIDEIVGLAVSKERERIVERVMKDAEEKHSGHEDWEYGDCDCDSLYDYKDVINLINTK